MHHARAHLMEYLGMREAALTEISRIPVHAFGDRKLEMTIADRASMGDVDGAQAILDRLGPSGDPSAYAFISGRVAWSRGDFDAAHAHFLAASARAYELARVDVYRRSLIYAAAIDVVGGRESEAISRLEQARAAMERRSLIDEMDTTLFLAQLHAAAGRGERSRAELARALAHRPADMPGGMKNAAVLTTLRLAPDLADRLPALPDEAAGALVRAHEALRRADPGAATQALDDARNAGAFKGRLADEARWLELRLGLPVTAEKPVDPPYPPVSRVVLRRELRASLAGSGHDPGPPRP